MPHWTRTINLESPIRQYKGGEIGIPELAEKVVTAIERSGWIADTPYPDTFRDLLEELKACTTVEEYVLAFDEVYDLADSDRVWIETW